MTSLLVLLLSAGAGGFTQASNAQRPTDATVVVTGSRLNDGRFHAVSTSLICGEVPPEYSMTGERAFIVEFPDAPGLAIRSIAFGSPELVSGKTTATKFRLTIGIKQPNGAEPPALAFDTQTPRPGHSGSITLTTTAGTQTLAIKATNDQGETIDLKVVCKPKP